MIDVSEILKIIEQGSNTNAPARITLKVIKKYCEDVLAEMDEYNENNNNG